MKPDLSVTVTVTQMRDLDERHLRTLDAFRCRPTFTINELAEFMNISVITLTKTINELTKPEYGSHLVPSTRRICKIARENAIAWKSTAADALREDEPPVIETELGKQYSLFDVPNGYGTKPVKKKSYSLHI